VQFVLLLGRIGVCDAPHVHVRMHMQPCSGMPRVPFLYSGRRCTHKRQTAVHGRSPVNAMIATQHRPRYSCMELDDAMVGPAVPVISRASASTLSSALADRFVTTL
jgi:hypothetical protein